MKYLLVINLLIITLLSPAQNNQNEDLGSPNRYDEYKGYKLDGMMGIQLGYHPANFNTIIYTIGGFPRYNFVAPKDWFSISAGAPVQLGFDLLSSNAGTFVAFTSDLPAVVDINLGSQSTSDSEYYIGGFIGGGVNYNLSYFLYNTQKIVSHSFGPVVHAGLRWIYKERPVGFRISYLKGIINNAKKDEWLVNDAADLYPSFITINATYGIL